MNLIAYIDGSSKGNPGEAGFGIVLKDSMGTVLKTMGKYIGRATNNVAEYQGLIGCLELARKYKARVLTVYSDSQLLVNQMNGSYQIKEPHLSVLNTQIREIIQSEGIRFYIMHISRDQNKEADQLARRAADKKAEI